MHLCQQGGHLLPYVHYSLPKVQKVLGAFAGDEAAQAAFTRAADEAPVVVSALPVVVAKEDWTFAGTPAPVANAVAALPTAVGKKGRDSQWRTRAADEGVKGVFPSNGRCCRARKSGCCGPCLSQRCLVLFILPVLWWRSSEQRWMIGVALVRSMPATAVR
jgi:hypothetical protein